MIIFSSFTKYLYILGGFLSGESSFELMYCHNGFPLDLDDHKNKNGVATDLFYTGVIGHLGYMFLN